MPAHHGPLGALRPHETTRVVQRPANENSLRWRTNLARGDQARQSEAAEAEFVSRVLAFEIQSALDEYKRANPDFPVKKRLCERVRKLTFFFDGEQKPDPARQRATLIVTDRAMDVMAPLIHEFTYQAMANDLLPIEDGSKYTCVFCCATLFCVPSVLRFADTSSSPLSALMRTRRRFYRTRIRCGRTCGICTCERQSISSWRTLTNS